MGQKGKTGLNGSDYTYIQTQISLIVYQSTKQFYTPKTSLAFSLHVAGNGPNN